MTDTQTPDKTPTCIGCGLPVVIEADEAAECWRCAEEAAEALRYQD